jgi:hypothetical protein
MGGDVRGNERGAGLITILFWLAAAGFVIWLAARVLPVYFEYWAISNVFQEQVRKGNLYEGPRELEKVILEELRFQDLERLKAADIEVERGPGDGRYLVSADYEAEVLISERVRLVFHFQPEARGGG